MSNEELRASVEAAPLVRSRERWENSDEFVDHVYGAEIETPGPIALAFASALGVEPPALKVQTFCSCGGNCGCH